MTKIAMIWDFDGTLADSYQPIGEALEALYKAYHLLYDDNFVRAYIVKTSVGQLLQELSESHRLSLPELQQFFKEAQEARDHQIQLMPYAKETLEATAQMGIQHFIYTHKGETTQAVLERLGIAHYFTEVVTAANGFKRKPDPEGVHYLLEKYQLDKETTYYIGDRQLDVAVAVNSGVKSINLEQPSSDSNIKIANLSLIVPLFQS